MPLYNYQCTDCQSAFTELRKASERDNSIVCPKCSSAQTKRGLTGFAIGESQKMSHPNVPNQNLDCGVRQECVTCPHS
jgi:putative FmdB family regulatory protein